jgi:hypothetical protein
LRQAVLVASELDRAAGDLRAAFGLGEPFRDPGVGMFGLGNVVFALGDCFIEVVSPQRGDTAAGRYLERHGGDGGYMVIFDMEDLEGARSRARERDVRAVWEIELPDIASTHLHPADMGGTIVSIDRSEPYGSWRWGGPRWTARVGEGAPGRLTGVTIAVGDPAGVAARWGEVLGVAPADRQSLAALSLDGSEIRFERAADERGEGLSEISLQLPPQQRAGRDTLTLNGVRFSLSDLDQRG